MQLLVFFILLVISYPEANDWYLPVKVKDRKDISLIELTKIGRWGEQRKARPIVPAHLHTGIDIKRPSKNYKAEPIFPAATGKVISMRDDGPYAQIIIEHQLREKTIWTIYEHISGILVRTGDEVDPSHPIARFMNRGELNEYGWHFDHLHFEVMKAQPVPLKPSASTPQRHFNTHTLTCYTKEDLQKRYLFPVEFLAVEVTR